MVGHLSSLTGESPEGLNVGFSWCNGYHIRFTSVYAKGSEFDPQRKHLFLVTHSYLSDREYVCALSLYQHGQSA